MRNTASFLGSLVLFSVFGCASSPPPAAANTGDPATAEPAPPAPPPPAADPAPAAEAAPAADPAPAAPAAEEKPAATESAKPASGSAKAKSATGSARAKSATGSAKPKPATESATPTPATESAKPKPATAGYTGPDPCKLATKGSSPVAEACRDGGVKAAKATMKQLVAKAKANGQKFSCDNCHKDPQDFTKLEADTPEKFKKLLAAAGK